jgi:hypothetical protein
VLSFSLLACCMASQHISSRITSFTTIDQCNSSSHIIFNFFSFYVTHLSPIESFVITAASSASSVISFYLTLMYFIAFNTAYSISSVLAGGVLTAYVGVVGLIKQLASDRCLPSVLLTTNRFAGNYKLFFLTHASSVSSPTQFEIRNFQCQV